MVESGYIQVYRSTREYTHTTQYMVESGYIQVYRSIRECIHTTQYMVKSGYIQVYRSIRECINTTPYMVKSGYYIEVLGSVYKLTAWYMVEYYFTVNIYIQYMRRI